MSGEDGYFDEPVAARYDESSAEMFSPERVDPVVDLLAELAGDGRALELAIGTGRIAVPLAQRGVPVHGIELSKAMAARLREKPGADEIGVTIGDFTSTRVDGTFTVAYLVYNTINNVTTQAEQTETFRNAAGHLQPGGTFVIEVGVPSLQRLPPGETVRPFLVDATRLGFDEIKIGRSDTNSVLGVLPENTVAGRTGQPAAADVVSVGKRLNNKVQLNYEQGLAAVEGTLKVTYRFTRGFELLARAGYLPGLDAVWRWTFR